MVIEYTTPFFQSATHSHACGINRSRFNKSSTFTDSFPLAWDRPKRLLGKTHNPRFTPTRVGQTPRGLTRSWNGSIHSHACGTNFNLFILNSSPNDSFPLAWDKPALHIKIHANMRFTPTRVGQTSRK